MSRHTLIEKLLNFKPLEVTYPICEAIRRLIELKEETRKYSQIALQDFGYNSKALKPVVRSKEDEVNRMLKPYGMKFEGFRDKGNYAELYDPENNLDRWIDNPSGYLNKIASKYGLTVSKMPMVQRGVYLRDEEGNKIVGIEPSYLSVSLSYPVAQELLEDLINLPPQLIGKQA